MADNSKQVSELPLASNVATTDRVMILRSPAANASVRTITFGNFCANIVVSNTVPANSSSNGLAGTIAYNSDHFYVCVANNTWKRATLATW